MSKIPYHFDTPVPKYFRENGWFKNVKTRIFITWCFERCNVSAHTVFHDKRKIDLDPFEFIFGRKMCSEETGLSEKEIRVQIQRLIDAGLWSKRASKTTNKFTVFKWDVSGFTPSKMNVSRGQQKGQQKGHQENAQENIVEKENQQQGPAKGPAKGRDEGHKLESKNKIYRIDMIDRVREENFLVCRHRSKNVVSTRMDLIFQAFTEKGYTKNEINDAIDSIKKQNPFISTPDAMPYLEKIILNSREKQYNETKRRDKQPKFKHRKEQREEEYTGWERIL